MRRKENKSYKQLETFVSIDEVGMGCMAGPMVFCGVKKHTEGDLSFAKDSKKLSKKKRDELVPIIYDNADVFVVEYTSQEVDNYGFTECIKMALQQIFDHFGDDQYIYDGGNNFGYKHLNTIVKGDSKVKSIAAASIVAKSFRDMRMKQLHEMHPEYDWVKNSGYVTKDHIQRVKQYGYTEFHRLSYNVKALEEEREYYLSKIKN